MKIENESAFHKLHLTTFDSVDGRTMMPLHRTQMDVFFALRLIFYNYIFCCDNDDDGEKSERYNVGPSSRE
jgi:hypothetical protein